MKKFDQAMNKVSLMDYYDALKDAGFTEAAKEAPRLHRSMSAADLAFAMARLNKLRQN